jgi:hypothetical protein
MLRAGGECVNRKRVQRLMRLIPFAIENSAFRELFTINPGN